MYCPKCGQQNPDNAQSCGTCGALFPPSPPTAAQQISIKTSGLAVTALVLGILSVFTCLLTAIPAIILGIVSLVKINNSAGQLKGKGMAVAGIAIPFAGLPIIAILMAILMPSLTRTRQIAFRQVCAANLSGLSQAMMIYEIDYGGYPTPEKWCDLLIKYADAGENIFICPGG